MDCFLVKANYARESLGNRSGSPDLSTEEVHKAFIAMQLTSHFANQKWSTIYQDLRPFHLQSHLIYFFWNTKQSTSLYSFIRRFYCWKNMVPEYILPYYHGLAMALPSSVFSLSFTWKGPFSLEDILLFSSSSNEKAAQNNLQVLTTTPPGYCQI